MFLLFIPHVFLLLLILIVNYSVKDEKIILKFERVIFVIIFIYTIVIGQMLSNFKFYSGLDDKSNYIKMFLMFYVLKFFVSDYIKYHRKKEDFNMTKKTLTVAIVHFISFAIFIYILLAIDNSRF